MRNIIGLLLLAILGVFLLIADADSKGSKDVKKDVHTKEYQFDGINCLENDKGKNPKPMNAFIGGAKKKVNTNEKFPNCMADFLKIATKPKCGTKEYDLFAYCSKLQFFGDRGVVHARENLLGNTTKMESRKLHPFEDIDEFEEEGKMQDMLLFLMDGCITCENKKEKTMIVQMKIEQIHPAGQIEEVCKKDEKQTFQLPDVVLTKGDDGIFYSNFKERVILHERLCPVRVNDEIKIGPLNYEHNIKLVVKNDCLQKGMTHVYNFPKISVFQDSHAVDHVIEIRGLNINLNKGNFDNKGNLLKDKKGNPIKHKQANILFPNPTIDGAGGTYVEATFNYLKPQ